MSMILEALRKSEAERQRGRAPGLFVEQQALARRDPRRPPAWAFVLLALLVALLLGWGWREWNRARSDAAAANAATAAADASAARAPEIATVDVAATTPAARVDAPLTDTTAAADPGVALVTAPPAPTRAPPPADPTSRPLPAPALDPATLPMLPADAAAPLPAGDAGTSAPVAMPTPPVEFLPRLADLGAGERAALPPLQLSMHVFSDDPARRFVIVDDKRLTEGALVAPGLVVEQIRRDGAVLSWDGRRMLLPRP
jgi:general secretion pathway protein B